MSIQWLFDVIEDRKKNPSEKSYTTSLFKEGLPKIAQKVGEEEGHEQHDDGGDQA